MRMDIAKDGIKTQFKKGHTLSAKYKPEYCQVMIDYFRDDTIPFPTFELFAASIGVINNTLLNWADKYSQFKNIYEQCKEIQKGKLLQGAMTDKYNAQFAKFFAINNCNMRESTNVAMTANVTNNYDAKTLDMIQRVHERLSDGKS